MRSSVVFYALLLTAVTASPNPQASIPAQSSVIAAPGTLGLGAICSNSQQCANGASCYGVSSSTITTCGSFQSTCTSNSQCATNTCNQGFCNGYLPPSSYLIGQTTTPAPTPTSTPSPVSTITYPPVNPSVTAAPGSLGLGAVCSTDAQCANGASCYGVTSFTIRTCGSFQAVCTTDSQCATNTCNQGFCNGYLSPSSYRISATSPITSTSLITSTKFGNSTATASPTRPAVTSTVSARPVFTGAASKLVQRSSCAVFGILAALLL